jgi:hypothetical protein
MSETVNHPPHYTSSPSGVEAIDICEHLSFNLGNALKYAIRAGIKTPDPTEDLRKCIWYLERELRMRQIYPGHLAVRTQEQTLLVFFLAKKMQDHMPADTFLAWFLEHLTFRAGRVESQLEAARNELAAVTKEKP